MFKILFGFIPSLISTFSNLKNFNEIYKNLQQQQKNVSLFHLGGHWIRLKVGGQPFIVRRKTLNRHAESILAGIAQDDKINSKIITDLFSVPFESMVHDDTTPPPEDLSNIKSDQNKQKNNKITNSTIGYNDNKKLPVINDKHLKYKQFKHNQEYLEELSRNEDILNQDEKKDRDENSHYFDEVENEKGEKKIKFEKDHDGFYLIDRDPVYFGFILNYLRTGSIQIPPSLDIQCFISDSKFYRLTELEMILNDRIVNDKRVLERQEIYRSEFSLHNILETNHKQNLYFMLPMNWFAQWKRFIDGGIPPPKTINTTVFFKTLDGYPIHSLKEGLRVDCDYICVSKETWLIFNKYYKLVGPILMRTTKDIYDNPPEHFISSKIWNVK
ncbi:hypothetical protein DICPUDRAFT_73850 [Dictyostelium purpureum]|uniref:DUSP domain-containing protein n=1 Tax=Dictyostelium purpureum TaxID=5786 RepID=F0Z621_DICPU|nr:uncharacterized protein DICPUDRAFT_73850 [Dictyostelium purpureum]EGC40578.1 hypothetical protein DICPUDRAFT_73850 [Dictyostelium purpureum]|eukprot:XP_003282914.1 hypothetical protein DICPUDRAFT_73850 [Dictyostelium purpureum]